jgi:hypothetical protein
MEAASTFETSVNFFQTTRRNNPEDNYLHTRRRENLKSHFSAGRSRYLASLIAILTQHVIFPIYTCILYISNIYENGRFSLSVFIHFTHLLTWIVHTEDCVRLIPGYSVLHKSNQTVLEDLLKSWASRVYWIRPQMAETNDTTALINRIKQIWCSAAQRITVPHRINGNTHNHLQSASIVSVALSFAAISPLPSSHVARYPLSLFCS